MAKVSVIIGSDSDLEMIQPCLDQLSELKIDYELRILSAHRSPEQLRKYIKAVEKKGVKVIIAGAGLSAHLPGVISSLTLLPVIGVPLSGLTGGLDALLSMVQMPGGVPVATMAVGKPGAKNSAILAGRILALNDAELKKRLKKMVMKMEQEVISKDKRIQAQLRKEK